MKEKNEIVPFIDEKEIRKKIYTIRDVQVMFDRDIAELYGVETKVLNQAVKRNIGRFPNFFMFQLTKDELENWKSQNVTSNKEKMGLRKCPFVFTEQGIAMLSAVLNSKQAIYVSIQIITAFISMRKMLISQGDLHYRISNVEKKQIEHKNEIDEKFEKVFNALEIKEEPKEKLICDGQIYEAYAFLCNLIRKVKNKLVIADNYIDQTIIILCAKVKKGTKVLIVTKKLSNKEKEDYYAYAQKHRFNLEIKQSQKFHDRCIIVDNKEVYWIGHSIKDLGTSMSLISTIGTNKVRQDIIDLINEI